MALNKVDIVTEALPNTVTHYRRIRPGPEAPLEAAVARSICGFVSPSSHPRWMAGSLPLGAGMPDLLIVTWEPSVVALANPTIADAGVLAYLRAVGCARLDTIVRRLRRPLANLECVLEGLVEADVVARESDRFTLKPVWRRILPEIVAVEAKVSDWRRAFRQAARNQVFSHRSFVALPERVAQRALAAEPADRLGIGVLSVSDAGEVSVARQASSLRPRVWAYYYELAHEVAVNVLPGAPCRSTSL